MVLLLRVKFDADTFKLVGKYKKTNTYDVWNMYPKCKIGIVRYDRCWRCYVFEPMKGIKFSYSCMAKISDFIFDCDCSLKQKINSDKTIE